MQLTDNELNLMIQLGQARLANLELTAEKVMSQLRPLMAEQERRDAEKKAEAEKQKPAETPPTE
jgi:hypothetical protein